MPRSFILTAAFTLVTLLALPVGAEESHREQAGAPEPSPQPNVLFILVDDLGYMDVSPNSPNTFYETPHIAKLAQSGVRFSNGYAACPVCSPTRASIMTGKYPARTKTTDYFCGKAADKLLPAEYRCRLPLSEVTLAEIFRASGYATFFAGKWHLGEKGYWPEDQGFDINKGGVLKGKVFGGMNYFPPYHNPNLKDGPEGEHLPDRLASETVSFIEQQLAATPEQPFLAYLSFYSVHTPLQGRPDLVKKYAAKAKSVDPALPRSEMERKRKNRLVQEHAVYGAMVEGMDLAVGKVLDALERLDVADNTIVIFFSDNGGLSTSEGHPTSNIPLRAGKGWMYEGGIRVPCIVRAPAITAQKQDTAGATCDEPMTSTDFFPTLLELAGLPLAPQYHVDGVSLRPLLENPKASLAREAIYWHYPHYGNQGGAPSGGVRHGDWKLIEWFEDDSIELFNLADDIGERNNLALKQPEQAAKLRQMLHDWRDEVDANMPKPNPAFK